MAVQLSSEALQDQHNHHILRSTTQSVCPKHTHPDDKRGLCMQTVVVSMSLQHQHPSVTDLTGVPRCSSTENPGGKCDVTRAGCYTPTKVSKSLKSHVTVLSMWHVIRSLAPPWSQQDPHQYTLAHPQRELLVNVFFFKLYLIYFTCWTELWMCERLFFLFFKLLIKQWVFSKQDVFFIPKIKTE